MQSEPCQRLARHPATDMTEEERMEGTTRFVVWGLVLVACIAGMVALIRL